jgi:hypothetical protein
MNERINEMDGACRLGVYALTKLMRKYEKEKIELSKDERSFYRGQAMPAARGVDLMKEYKKNQSFIDRKEGCENCYYSFFYNDCGYDVETIFCFRNPKVLNLSVCNRCNINKTDCSDRCLSIWSNPLCNTFDWCGEWKPKQKKREVF